MIAPLRYCGLSGPTLPSRVNADSSSAVIDFVRAIISSTRFGSMPLAAAYFSAMSSRPLAPADAVAPDVPGPPAKVLRPPPPLTFLSDSEFCDTYPSTSPALTFTHAPSRARTSSFWPFLTVATTLPAALGAARRSSSGRFTHTSSASASVAPPAIASANAALARRRPNLVFMFVTPSRCPPSYRDAQVRPKLICPCSFILRLVHPVPFRRGRVVAELLDPADQRCRGAVGRMLCKDRTELRLGRVPLLPAVQV